MENPTKCKIVLLGDQSVGKTSVINRFIFDNFTGNEQPTVGVDFVSKTVNIDTRVLRMQLWDTAGQQRFYSLIPSYIKDCSAAIIVFDLTSPNSFNNIGRWVQNVKQIRGEQALILILANKCDLKDERVVSKASIQTKMKQLNLKCSEVSAKSGENIMEFFKELASIIASGEKKGRQSFKQKKISQAIQQSTNNNNNNQPIINLTNKSQLQTEKVKKKKKCC